MFKTRDRTDGRLTKRRRLHRLHQCELPQVAIRVDAPDQTQQHVALHQLVRRALGQFHVDLLAALGVGCAITVIGAGLGLITADCAAAVFAGETIAYCLAIHAAHRAWRPLRMASASGGVVAVTLAIASLTVGNAHAAKEPQPRPLGDLEPQLHHTLAQHAHRVSGVVFAPNGLTIASADVGNAIMYWDSATGQHRETFHPADGNNHITHIAYGGPANGLFVVSTTTPFSGGFSGALLVWGSNPNEFVRINSNQSGSFRTSAVQQFGSLIAAADNQGKVRVWDAALARREPVPKRPKQRRLVIPEVIPTAAALQRTALTLCFAPVAKVGKKDKRNKRAPSPVRLAAGFNGGVALLTIDAEGVKRDSNQFAAIRGQVFDVQFSPDGKKLAVALKNRLEVWVADETDDEPLWSIATTPSRCLAYDPTGRMLAAGYADGAVRIWNTANKKKLGELETTAGKRVSSVAFNHDGTLLAAGSDDTHVRVWKLFREEEDRRIARIRERRTAQEAGPQE